MNFEKNLERLLRVSPAMRDALHGHPEWHDWLRERVEARGELLDGCDFARQSGLPAEPHSETLPLLQSFKRREYLYIAFCDVAGLASFNETVTYLSRLAEWATGIALRIAWHEMTDKKPADVPHGEGFSVIAMGKLGGCELNYSSDVDLVFCRRGSEDDAEARFFTRLGERLVQLLGQPGPDGALYRVDMRLRPHGDTGPLVPTIDSIENYYESWSESWERQALIKARPIAGDEKLGGRFSRFAERFVFARQMDDSSLEEIKRVKFRSEKEYARAGDRFHIKQGSGGIRDIEFYVQYLQLIAGSKHPPVRTGTTLAAIIALASAKALLEGEESLLSLAYVFLRVIEHHLQLRHLTPEALLPDNARELEQFARDLGFEASDSGAARALSRALETYRAHVRAVLERVYLTPGTLRPREREEEFAQLLTERAPKERVRELLSQYGFRDTDKAWQNIRLMALGPAGSLLPPQERRAFLEAVFPLLEVLRASFDPDQALHHLESFASATGNRVSFIRTLASRKAHLARLANLLALSKLSHQILMRHPEYFDSLARGIHLHEGRRKQEMLDEVWDRLVHARGVDAGDILRRFRQREMIRIAYRDLAGLAGPLEISAELSELADACLNAGMDLAEPDKNGPDSPPIFQVPLHVVALGKFGSRQMHYSSDLDLLILYDDPPPGSTSEFRTRLQLRADRCVEWLLDLFGGVTREGVTYKIDLRLRPEGSAGLLARSWSSFVDHARQYMQPWERMALVRSRIVRGGREFESRWEAALREIVFDFEWDSEAVRSIRHLKRRVETESNKESRTYLDFKLGKGGIADLEFVVQFLQVTHGKNFPELRTPGCAEALASLHAARLITQEEHKSLSAAHSFQRRLENHFQLIEEWTSHEVSRESPGLERLAASLGYRRQVWGDARRAMLADWEAHCHKVRELVDRYFYGEN